MNPLEHYYPTFQENNLKFFKKNKSSMSIVSENYAFLDQLNINLVGKEVLERSTGQHSVEDIIQQLLTVFNDVTYDVIKEDVLEFFHFAWRLELVTWKNGEGPHMSYYHSENGAYSVVFPDDSSTLIDAKGAANTIQSPYREKVLTNPDFFRHQFISNSQVCFMKNDDQSHVMIEWAPSFKFAANVNSLCFSDELMKNRDEQTAFLNWALKSYAQISGLEKPIENLFLYMDRDQKSEMEMLQQHADFYEVGVLENELIDLRTNQKRSVCVLARKM